MRHVNLVGEIGCEWDGFTASQVTDALAEAADAGEDVTFHVNSPGGSVADAVMIDAMFRAFAQDNPDLEAVVEVDGMAASAASFAFLDAARIVAHPSSMFMVHDPSSWAWGNADELRRLADTLDKCRDAIVTSYVRRTGRHADEVRAAMADETWFTADEALAWGLCDSVLDDPADGAGEAAAGTGPFTSKPQLAAIAADAPIRCDAATRIDSEPLGAEPEGEAPEGAEGEAPRAFCVNGHIYRLHG